MRKSYWVGILAGMLVIAGVTIAWVGFPEGNLRATTIPALAQSMTVEEDIADSGQRAIKEAIAKVGPAVVRVDVTATVSYENPFDDMFSDPRLRQFFNLPFDDTPREELTESFGSGVVIDYGGEKLVLTNAHVVDGAEEIVLTDADGYEWDASVVGSDELLDIAVLRIDGDTSGFATATLGDSSTIEIGDWAIAIGNPIGLSYSVTMGIISSTDRDGITKPSGVGTYSNLIQTDAAINPGNSGGPLVNAYGEVIGINTLIARNSMTGVTIEGINFAVGINGVKDVLGQLVSAGEVKRGWLGVGIIDVTPAVAEAAGIDPEQPGAFIAEVFPGDPADLAGLEVEDVVLRIGDETIADADDLIRVVALLGVGTQVEFDVLRDGETLTFDVTLSERPSEQNLVGYEGQVPSDTSDAAGALGLEVGRITSVVARHLGLNSTDGVVIMEVVAGSRADEAGLLEGDVILGIDGQSIESVEQWDSAVAELEDSQVTLTLYRDGRLRFVEL